MTTKPKILAVDDQQIILDTLKLMLGERVDFLGVTDAQEAFDHLTHRGFDIVLSDYHLNHEISGLQIFKRAKRKNPWVTACMMTADDAAPKLKEVFETFGGILIEKPFSENAFDNVLALAEQNMREQADQSQAIKKESSVFDNIVAETPSMLKLLDLIKKVAPDADLPIHFSGPTGTGKTTLAETIHKLSGVKGKFTVVNCAGLEELAHSRLFGHIKGSFTGALRDQDGFVKQADGGTLFLDEFHLLPKDVQGKLLRVLNDGTYERLGESGVERVSRFRLITAASVNMKPLAEAKSFLPDLWFRVSTKILDVPSLSERRACIPRLVYRKLADISKRTGREHVIDAPAMDLLVSFSWDGNVRDLNNCLQSICSELGSGETITPDRVTEDLAKRSGSFDKTPLNLKTGDTLKNACKNFEISLISQTIRANKGNVARAAKALGLPRETLRSKVVAYGL